MYFYYLPIILAALPLEYSCQLHVRVDRLHEMHTCKMHLLCSYILTSGERGTVALLSVMTAHLNLIVNNKRLTELLSLNLNDVQMMHFVKKWSIRCLQLKTNVCPGNCFIDQRT